VLTQLLTSKEVYKVFSKKLQPEGPESLPKACLLVERMTDREVAVFLENKHMLHHVLKLERGDLSGWVFTLNRGDVVGAGWEAQSGPSTKGVEWMAL
jgi:hypothetical protein